MSYATSIIKSIQRGTITFSGTGTTATATITSVDTAKSFIAYGGASFSYNNADAQLWTKIYLTNATTVTISRYSGAGSYAVIIPYQVVEYY